MGPPKRKGTSRRQVLDLNSREESPSRPTWQTKYQQILTRDGVQQNGDSQPGSSEMISSTTSTSKSNPLSGLVGNYNSDSDSEENTQQSTNLDAKVEDFLKEIQSISTEPTNHVPKASTSTYPSQPPTAAHTPYPATVTAWQQCIDQNSGYPYYWNMETNEVTWEMPADLKTALASVANATNKPQPKPPEKPAEKKKPVVKYPWQTESDSEDEKIEMITSFGGEESDEDEKKKKGGKGKKGGKEAIGPKLPIGPLLPPGRPSAIRSSHVSSHDDSEVLNETVYETSSLLTHCIQDTGPPGDETFPKETVSSSQVAAKIIANEVPDSSAKEEDKCDIKTENDNSNQSTEEHPSRLNSEPPEPEKKILADDVIAQIENELPPDYSSASTSKSEQENGSKISGGMALVASYGDDSETEENPSTEKKKPTKPLFPIGETTTTEKRISPLFPCVEQEPRKPFNFYENHNREELSNEVESKNYAADPNLPDSTTTHKAFKRKKRIEFATTNYGPSSSKMSEKAVSPEPSGSSGPVIQYNMDPSSNEHRGFGFSANVGETDKKKSFKGHGGIQFIKAETINLNKNAEGSEKTEGNGEVAQNKSNIKEKVPDEDIESAAALLKEKVTFLTEGKDEISPVQIMALQLETLVLAWQQGALTATYLSRWLNEKCAELNRHEKSAAPPGWTCLWDRKNKRYFYRNATTKAIQWEYPNVDDKGKDVEGGGEEMDLCDTPPHLSPSEAEKTADEQPLTPPPPIISDNTDSSPPSPTPPPPPQISFCKDEKGSNKHGKKKKRKTEEVSSSSEGDLELSTVIIPPSHLKSEKPESTPPLPPMPHPPPPPPEEPPPPLPESPPPLPIDPDQPLPPGVDEPEVTLYRRHSPKHSFKKTQPDSSSAYPPEVMMTYGYGLAVQPVVSSSSQGLAIPMHEYHNYVHDAVSSNHFVIQAAPPAIHHPAKKPKLSLNSELDSFYSDIAMLDGGSNDPEQGTPSTSQEPAPAQPPPPPPVAPTPSTSTSTSSVSSPVAKILDSTNFNQPKKKKKTKLAPGLSMKKKGVSSLVAKWQQVQQEVRRDYNSDDDDDDDDVSSTHK